MNDIPVNDDFPAIPPEQEDGSINETRYSYVPKLDGPQVPHESRYVPDDANIQEWLRGDSLSTALADFLWDFFNQHNNGERMKLAGAFHISPLVLLTKYLVEELKGSGLHELIYDEHVGTMIHDMLRQIMLSKGYVIKGLDSLEKYCQGFFSQGEIFILPGSVPIFERPDLQKGQSDIPFSLS